ncbi:Ser-Thr-rich glycosyl-phosphatidyl-inositol-anchored membrane family-domain-containing protein [Aspergillus cavernicola]|uniref:Ser-Thr-rich glycosyl-phosphatidyl-inositol-anchored membrane family-domain-containing protein n=1 Tax=Aspergillus cavernicola TaxID=176166 RepID=A0ABR4J5I9_9EURO
MHFTSPLSLLTFAVSALALTITSPSTTNQKVDLSEPFTIRWTTVPSDPQNFTITLVNMLGHNVNQDLVKNIDSSEEEYTIEGVDDIPIANNYQINFRSTDRENMGILAQSPMFNVTKVAEEERDNTTATTATQSAPSQTETNAAGGKGVVVGSGVVALMMGFVAVAL